MLYDCEFKDVPFLNLFASLHSFRFGRSLSISFFVIAPFAYLSTVFLALIFLYFFKLFLPSLAISLALVLNSKIISFSFMGHMSLIGG